MTRHLRLATCPRADQHTPMPEDPAAYFERMTVLSRTHDQHRCGGCGLWSVWRPREDLRGETG